MSSIRTILTVAALLLGGCAMDTGPRPAAAAPVRVLVEIAVAPGAPVADAQAAVIAALPATGARVVRRYSTLPLLALEVDPAVLPSLLTIPQVTSVRPDRERSPMQ
jgi:hypothetical protein